MRDTSDEFGHQNRNLNHPWQVSCSRLLNGRPSLADGRTDGRAGGRTDVQTSGILVCGMYEEEQRGTESAEEDRSRPRLEGDDHWEPESDWRPAGREMRANDVPAHLAETAPTDTCREQGPLHILGRTVLGRQQI